MKFTIISTLLAVLPLIAQAAPTAQNRRETNLGDLSGLLGAGGQEAVAEVFKGGDAILNIPGDVMGKLLSGNPEEAVKTAMDGITKTVGGLPADIGKIMGGFTGGAIGGGGAASKGASKDASKNTPKSAAKKNAPKQD